jgi:endo-1,4-beta-xylanase
MTRHLPYSEDTSLSNVEQYSWVPSTFSGQGAACLFGEDLNRKLAYYGVVSALSGAVRPAGTVSAAVVTSPSAAKSSTAAATQSPGGMTTSYMPLSSSTATSSAASTIALQSSVTTTSVTLSTSAAAADSEGDDTCDV